MDTKRSVKGRLNAILFRVTDTTYVIARSEATWQSRCNALIPFGIATPDGSR